MLFIQSPLRKNAEAYAMLADRWFGNANRLRARRFLMGSDWGLRPPIKRARLRVASRKRGRIVGERKSLLVKAHLRHTEVLPLQRAGDARKLQGEQRTEVALFAANLKPNLIGMDGGPNFNAAHLPR